MANADSTLRDNDIDLICAGDKLSEARTLVCFMQTVTLVVRPDQAVLLQPSQLTGLYFVMQNAIERIKEAEDLIASNMKKAEVLPHGTAAT